MKKTFLIPLLVLGFCLAALAEAASPKYVFLFIGDGMSVPQRSIAEEFSKQIGRGPLVINSFPMQALTRTSSADALITDSAAAATAIACGEKTKNGQLGVSADLSQKLISCAVKAHEAGKKVGIITSVTINHATPAGFYAHQPSRGLLYRIGLDLIDSDFEFFGGGGFSGQHDKTDDEMYKGNLYDLAQQAGYTLARSRDELNALAPDTPKALALYGEGALPYAIDDDPNAPTLAEFTRKGVELLSHENPRGFFMMVEGGAIDYRGHANDAAGNLREVLAFDDAVKVAMEFAAQHPEETLIVTTGDHETGGMTMGFANAGYGLNLLLLAQQKCTPEVFDGKVAKARAAKEDFSMADAEVLLNENFGFLFSPESKGDKMYINDEERKELEKAFHESGKLGAVAKLILQNKAGIGWSSGNHTALPVLTTSMGCGAERFSGFLENTDISHLMKELL
ncbi:MAG: alkaline phosphatase [Oligosphaeraceae bacterium]